MARIDLHTHSAASPDGGITAAQYRKVLRGGLLDYVAVTDHNTVDFALGLQRELGEHIIVGEEIMTREGEIIGLYLQKNIPKGLSASDTVGKIKQQGGLVYIPHPFETVRHGISEKVLLHIMHDVDIIEVGNGRAVFQNKSAQAAAWAKRFQKAAAAASDAHGIKGWGRTFTELPEAPTRETLVELLQRCNMTVRAPGAVGLLYPKLNRVRKALYRD